MDALLQISTLDAWPVEADDLVTLALKDDFRALLRLREDWCNGSNGFARPGEQLFAARFGTVLAGLGGLNRDPFAAAEGVGRLRRLYVSPHYRRRGVGSALVEEILAHAKGHFSTVRLRTDRPDADAFYVALGFRRTPGNPYATHEVDLRS